MFRALETFAKWRDISSICTSLTGDAINCTFYIYTDYVILDMHNAVNANIACSIYYTM